MIGEFTDNSNFGFDSQLNEQGLGFYQVINENSKMNFQPQANYQRCPLEESEGKDYSDKEEMNARRQGRNECQTPCAAFPRAHTCTYTQDTCTCICAHATYADLLITGTASCTYADLLINRCI